MSCNTSKLDLCFLIQEGFKSPTFKFDVDISKDDFIYNTRTYYLENKEQKFDVLKADDNTIYIKDIYLNVGDYFHEMLWVREGKPILLFQGKLEVRNRGFFCANDNSITNVDFIFSEQFFERGEKGETGDPGALTYIKFFVDENMELNYTSDNEIKFKIENGNLKFNVNE